MLKSLKINREKLFNHFFDRAEDRKIKYLVFHHICDQNLEKAIDNLKHHQVSAHYIINDDGKIFQLVEENNIAYHAGISYWSQGENINKSSIGIEFFSKDPYKIGFSKEQINSAIILAQNIVKKYQILPKNIVGHSDIAYDKETGFLNRKDDPSFLFNWKEFAKNNIGIYPMSQNNTVNDKILYKFGNKCIKIRQIKEKLYNFGYRVQNINDEFDQEFLNLTIIFNRRFNPQKYQENKEFWHQSSSNIISYFDK